MKRISFLISKEIYTLLQKRASKAGVSASYLMRKWLEEPKVFKLQNTVASAGGLIQCSIRLEDKIFNKISKESKDLGISLSDYLRLTVQKYLHEASPENTENQILFSKGYFAEFIYSTKPHLETVSNDMLHKYIKASNEMAQYENAKYALSLLTNRLADQNEKTAFQKLYLAETYLALRDLSKASEFLDEVPITSHGLILGKYYFLRGNFYLYSNEFEKALNFYETALEYFDLLNHSSEIATLYLQFSRVYEYQFKFDLAHKYVKKAYKIISLLNSKFLTALYFGRKGCIYISQGKYSLAQELAIKSKTIYSDILCMRGMYRVLQDQAILLLKLNEYDKSYLILKDGEKYALQLKGRDKFSYEALYQAYIESANDYEYSIYKLKK